jgi:hypothetical protein
MESTCIRDNENRVKMCCLALVLNLANKTLEDRFREKGSAKFTKGEFLLYDQDLRTLDLRRPWRFFMKPGERRYLSVKFTDSTAISTTSCSHCGTDKQVTLAVFYHNGV